MIDAGKYNRKIEIHSETISKDAGGFPVTVDKLVLACYAEVKTTSGFTIIRNGSDFEKAYTRFTIRYPVTEINRKMFIMFNGVKYTIEYINNINNANVELELQCKEVTH